MSAIDNAQARVKRRMVQLPERTFLLVDHGKFGVRSAVPRGSLSEADVLVTDAGTDGKVLEELRPVGLKPEVADRDNGGN